MGLQRGRGGADRLPLALGEADRDLGGRNAQPGGGHSRGIFVGITQYHVGSPVPHRTFYRRQHRRRRQPAEQFPGAEHRRLARRQDRKPLPDGSHLLLGRLAAREERMARRSDHARQCGRACHQRLRAVAPRLVEERRQRPEVARAP